MTKLDYIVDLLATNWCTAECEKCPFGMEHEECVLAIDTDPDARWMRVKGIIIEAVMEWADGLAMEFMYRRMKEGY